MRRSQGPPSPSPSGRQVGTEERHGRFWLGFVAGLIAPPVLWCVGLLVTGPFPFLFPVGVLGVGLAFKVSDEQRRTGDGILSGFAVEMVAFTSYLLWWLHSGHAA